MSRASSQARHRVRVGDTLEARTLEAEAGDTPDPATAAKLETLQGQVQTLFRGETLRGLLLTSYGFSIFGERAQQAAWVCFGAALVLLLASIAGFVHAASTSKDRVVT